MPRGKKVSKRVIAPDAKYNSELVAKFINFVMERGKKSVAQALVYGAIDTLGEIKKVDGLKFFEQAIEVVKPQVEVRSKRVGGANYQVPVPVQSYRQNALAFRWIITAARAKKGKSMKDKLATEFVDILDGTGSTMKKKEDVQRMAEANKAFAHFARFGSKK
ncbi:MAG: 30S ribosomal protein S7 [Candidatus Magasanikbacteria bacterium RIFCSPLOWO2_12_FULL_34_7]|nr:MAG: 30S ribosomal protein S7 [Candidatus Magasanikbacteria bacterium RIFCSPLOWO2_12_FULL_34_7]